MTRCPPVKRMRRTKRTWDGAARTWRAPRGPLHLLTCTITCAESKRLRRGAVLSRLGGLCVGHSRDPAHAVAGRLEWILYCGPCSFAPPAGPSCSPGILCPQRWRAPSSWSLPRGKQSQPSFCPFQTPPVLDHAPCPKTGTGSQAWAKGLHNASPHPLCPLSSPEIGGFFGGSCVTSCTKTFLKPLFRDFCPAGWGRGGGGCLPC